MVQCVKVIYVYSKQLQMSTNTYPCTAINSKSVDLLGLFCACKINVDVTWLYVVYSNSRKFDRKNIWWNEFLFDGSSWAVYICKNFQSC